MNIRILIVSIVLLNTFFGLSQSDFNDFKNLCSSGEIPDDFTTEAFQKISDDFNSKQAGIKGDEELIFLQSVHYTIHDLLHSGMVVYGDPVSNYVSEIADKLLAKDPDLRKKLRFYTIKSNETNAFSTYQGIIFVTTGLLSQLTSEAQLAYVLAHEISHYTEKHVIETFEYAVKNNSQKIKSLSNFSKEKEFEADKLGIKMYYEAGYSKNELISTFDVLLYSYLPFDELEFSKEYLNSELMTIPEGFYSVTNFPIKAEEDADDKNSSHPNIKKRKDAIEKQLSNFTDWGTTTFTLGEERFKNIRNICRFESIRTDIIGAEFDNALYSIYILEKQYPNSMYLKHMKAKAWLALAQYKTNGFSGVKIPNKKDLEGEIGQLQYLLKTLTEKQILSVSMRMIEDLKNQHPNNEILLGIWDRMVKHLATNSKFELEKYANKTYQIALQEFQNTQKDTLKTTEPEGKNALSKYDIIKNQNNVQIASGFDSSIFYLYALSDLTQSSEFKDRYTHYKEELQKLKEEQQAYDDLTEKERKKYNKEHPKEEFHLGSDKLIYLEPVVSCYSKHGIDRIKSEKLQVAYTNAVKDFSKDFGVNVNVISSSNLKDDGTEAFNQRSLLMAYLTELTDNEKIDVFPTDFVLLKELREKTGSDKVMLSIMEYQKRRDWNGRVILGSILFYPILFFYIPTVYMKQEKTEFTTLIFDLSSGEILSKETIQSVEPINEFTVQARVFELINSLKVN